jgi:hypothetical protein
VRLLLVTPSVFLPLGSIDVHRINRTLRPARARLAAWSILRFAFRQLGRHLGIAGVFYFRADVSAWHRARPERRDHLLVQPVCHDHLAWRLPPLSLHHSSWQHVEPVMIRKLKDGRYRLYSRKKNPKTGKRRNLGTFRTRAAAQKHERAVQFFKRGG